MTLSAAQVLKAYNDEQFLSFSSYMEEKYGDGWSSVDSWSSFGYSNGKVTIDGDEYEWEYVENIGGEGEGEYRAVVFRVGDQLFRKEGYYQSHYGSDWDGNLEEVEAFEKTVTDYRPI